MFKDRVHGPLASGLAAVRSVIGSPSMLPPRPRVKYVPGRKSDVQYCQWLQKLMSYGLLRAAFRPAAEVCVIRAVARQRDVLLTS
jgi:hypothetical protein